MAYNNLLVVVSNHIATITINRPDKLNALNKATLDEIEVAFDTLEKDEEVRGIIITGSGEKAFVAGADITEFKEMTPQNGAMFAKRGQDLFSKIEAFKKPVIAAVNGFALGGGCELAMACHMRVASEKALFGQPEVNLGIIPGYGGTQRLTQLIGRAKATELMITADMISAEQAMQLGLVNSVVSGEDLLVTCQSILAKVVARPPIQVGYILNAVNAHYSSVTGYETEAHLFGQCLATEDFSEGVDAFLEKRQAEFKGK
jgi:enoyl-CoA hydratase